MQYIFVGAVILALIINLLGFLAEVIGAIVGLFA